MDISGAYLNAPMDGAPVYMKLSADVSRAITELDPLYRDYVRPDGTVIVKLMRALYGCVQSAKLCYNHLKTTIESLQFCANTKDQCVFNKPINDIQIIIVFHVDDLMKTCSDEYFLTDTVLAIDLKNTKTPRLSVALFTPMSV